VLVTTSVPCNATVAEAGSCPAFASAFNTSADPPAGETTGATSTRSVTTSETAEPAASTREVVAGASMATSQPRGTW